MCAHFVVVLREGDLQGLMHSWGKFTPGAMAKKACCCQSEMHGEPVQWSVLPLSGSRAVAQWGLDLRDHLTLAGESCYATTRQFAQKKLRVCLGNDYLYCVLECFAKSNLVSRLTGIFNVLKYVMDNVQSVDHDLKTHHDAEPEGIYFVIMNGWLYLLFSYSSNKWICVHEILILNICFIIYAIVHYKSA